MSERFDSTTEPDVISIEENAFEGKLRPRFLTEYIGQDKVKEKLKIFLTISGDTCRFKYINCLLGYFAIFAFSLDEPTPKIVKTMSALGLLNLNSRGLI